MNFSRHEIALRTIQLLNNNQYVFGPNRRPIIQFSVESRRALQLKEQRRERVHAKQELLKNPMNPILSFESNKKKKQQQRNTFDQSTKKIRLSEIIKQKGGGEEEEEEQNDQGIMETNNPRVKSNIEKSKKKKRPKTKSKAEIRDKLDRMIAHTRNKPQLPQRTKKKWFE